MQGFYHCTVHFSDHFGEPNSVNQCCKSFFMSYKPLFCFKSISIHHMCAKIYFQKASLIFLTVLS
jgi:hypothetical protein